MAVVMPVKISRLWPIMRSPNVKRECLGIRSQRSIIQPKVLYQWRNKGVHGRPKRAGRLPTGCGGHVEMHLSLKMKPTACYFGASLRGLSFLGVRIFPRLIRVKAENLRRATRRIQRRRRQLLRGEITHDTYYDSMNSYWAYLSSFDTLGLRRDLLERGLGQ